MTTYLYRGDRLTDEKWRGKRCVAVLRLDGKCVRSHMGTMLVEFVEPCERVVVLARQLRKVKD